MEHLYSIMPLHVEHLEEICQDIKEQYERGVATCALFFCKLVPEGKPLINKAAIFGEQYVLFRDRLKELGLECGILVQCSIGHGYPLNEESALTHYINVKDGQKQYVACPYDEGFQEYIRWQMEVLASYQPSVIMVDDDYRLMYRPGRGCACPLHMQAFTKRYGKEISRETLYGLLLEKGNKREKELFVETQREALLAGAKAMRAGMDAVDKRLQGVFCCVGPTTEFAAEIAQILAGEGNPTVVRLNNGNYAPDGARWFSDIAFRAADDSYRLKKGGVDYILAETDTCPQNRYSTGASSLHTHFVGSILEGVNGAKHWITRLTTHEPSSGKAYRKMLGDYRGFYTTLSNMVPTLRFEGCRIPLTAAIRWEFQPTGWEWKKNAWLRCVLERYGFPVYCDAENGGAAFLEGDFDEGLTDEEILAALAGTIVLDVAALDRLNARGFGAYTGVAVQEWKGAPMSFEKFADGKRCAVQVGAKQLLPIHENVKVDSVVYHLQGGKNEIPLFPAVTLYENDLGGKVIAVCGTPNTNFTYWEAFSFLNESRKAQFARLLQSDLPMYYDGDAEVYMKTGLTADGKRFCAFFNIGLDILENLPFVMAEGVKGVQTLQKDGSFAPCAFEKTAQGIVVNVPAYTLLPVILLMEME